MEYKKPIRFFEKSGVVNPEVSYYVPLKVVNTDNLDVKTMVDMGRYFSIFAPRQSGKTTSFRRFCESLEQNNIYITILLSFQDCKSLDVKQFYNSIETELYAQLIKRLKDVYCDKLEIVNKFLESQRLTDHLAFKSLFIRLNEIIESKKIVIFIDEFDGIPSSELENFLCTLRELYQRYKEIKQKALYSVGLVGIRNITKLVVGGVSPFKIADRVNLPRFSLKNVEDLYAQYTEETNQPFTEEAVQKVYEETRGQPWLVNRLGTILTVNVKPETLEPIIEDDVEKAVKILLKEQNNHFDNLIEKAKQYKERFVEIVFNGVEYDPDEEEQNLLELHGLISEDNDKAIVANNIYKKRFVKMFFREVSSHVDLTGKRYYLEDGFLNMELVLSEFEKYIARIGVRAFYEKGRTYEKTGQFLLTAWLYQFIAGTDGDLRYECPTGLGRMDILLTFKGRKYIIETKIKRYKGILDEAVAQLRDKYLKAERVAEGYVIVFDPDTQAGELCVPKSIQISESRQIISFNIGIGKIRNE
ncbi:MAG: Archaeal ATPase [Candidatus Scalindua rubra]|uniref:Archaeal ATPase n=1 Tax=Candidatus Scalindua rubra TaxID=1872076 RepID=A0A1E3XDL3_9BACT|nr:MAG: Archaeal ATPase [Candidatus Scalindua rubra]